MAVARGEIWERHDPSTRTAAKVVVVSSDIRNRSYPTVIVCPVLEQLNIRLPRAVALGDGEPLEGTVLCDVITTVAAADLSIRIGAISRSAVAAVGFQLVAALELST